MITIFIVLVLDFILLWFSFHKHGKYPEKLFNSGELLNIYQWFVDPSFHFHLIGRIEKRKKLFHNILES